MVVRLFFKIIIMITVLGCTGDTAQRKRINNIPESHQISTIGIYVDPSDQKIYDTQLSNLTQFRFLSMGYRTVDLNSIIASPTRFKQTFSIKDNNSKIIQYVLNDLNHLESEQRDSLSLDAIAVLNPKWKKLNFLYRHPTTRKVYEADQLRLDLSLDIVERTEHILLFSRKIIDTTEIYLNENIEKEFASPKSSSEVIYTRVPINIFLQRNVSGLLNGMPVSNIPIEPQIKYNFPVIFVVDSAYRDFFGEQWRQNIQKRMEIRSYSLLSV